MGSGGELRNRRKAILCLELRNEGKSLSQIALAVGISKDQVITKIALAQRLMQLDNPLRPQDQKHNATQPKAPNDHNN